MMYKPEIISNAEYHGRKHIYLLQMYALLKRIKNSLSIC
ncbi:MAG: hypothetical protein CM15mV46_710 [Caudoviricetes sp.]|nr:MAG: hypothetical protein CM15mV46_710 [Caudoviricetes sp.]